MQTVKQQFEPQRACWKRIIYSCVFAAGITLNHTKSLHLLGMLSAWDQNRSVRVDSPSPFFLRIAFYFSEILAKKKRDLPASIQMPYLYLDLRQRKAGKVGCESPT